MKFEQQRYKYETPENAVIGINEIVYNNDRIWNSRALSNILVKEAIKAEGEHKELDVEEIRLLLRPYCFWY